MYEKQFEGFMGYILGFPGIIVIKLKYENDYLFILPMDDRSECLFSSS
jgi:hypothetical protein